MICCCALAGTSACEHCNRKVKYENRFEFEPDIITIPYKEVAEEKRFQEIENAIKRLNERIDEILGEEE